MKEYFGIKGMTMHVDVFALRKSNGELKKHVYLTLIYQSDQGTVEVAKFLCRKISKSAKVMSAIMIKIQD